MALVCQEYVPCTEIGCRDRLVGGVCRCSRPRCGHYEWCHRLMADRPDKGAIGAATPHIRSPRDGNVLEFRKR